MWLRTHCTLHFTVANPTPFILMLRPRSGGQQWVARESYTLKPSVPVIEFTDSYGNLCQRLTVPQGKMRIAVEVIVKVPAQIEVATCAPRMLVTDMPADVLHYLRQSRYCPSDKMQAKALQVVGNALPGYPQVAKICSWIHENLQYRYGVSSSTTDALDTLQQGAGVCRDFAHVGIALCRSLQIPARMVAGYLHGLKPMDLHAWFEAFVGGRWYTFDATQAAPRGGRIVVAYGHDAADVAFISDYGMQPLRIDDMFVNVVAI